MPKSSMQELRGQIAAGEYAIDSRILADDIVSKFALVRRVARLLISEDERGAADEAGRGAQLRRQRGSEPATRRSSQRSKRLP